ncbi:MULTISPECIES: ABC transporter substrate-binding protein [unclassified Marinobacter]|uniref:ABC transporter substrate-binding protein n=1 Tax=unclassified Marinobacter TaxID=83889 RepID=UPI0026E460EE|nr:MULTISPECIES: ABC transporter substrate-binding protein [unclassified Marinobacter]MDO6442263.1 ABC transporter substrate-binding protein [Marinobacter sp. 2_MG-2023]MDO6824967.1 ABC transporter substrate-binding protein [Marinobacter sp. 1_MG-2023]
MTENAVLFWKLAKATLLRAVLIAVVVVGSVSAQTGGIERSPVYLAVSGNVALDQHIHDLLQQSFHKHWDLISVSGEQAALIEDAPVITIGPGAFSRVRQANRKVPVLAMLTTRDFLEGFASRSPGQISGVYFDVPLLRQALIGKTILPHASRIALIATTASAELYDSLIDELPQYGLEAQLFIVKEDKQLIPTLVRALSYGDFLLAAPDNAIYNPRTIKHVLLTAYRRNRIVIGPSQAYVKAGSIAAGYAPFPVMTEMAAEYLQEFFETGTFPEPDYPPSFNIAINQQVARSLNIPLAPKEQIVKSVELQIENKGVQIDE